MTTTVGGHEAAMVRISPSWCSLSLSFAVTAGGCVRTPEGGFGFEGGMLASDGTSGGGAGEGEASTAGEGPAGSSGEGESGGAGDETGSSSGASGPGGSESGGGESGSSTTGEPGMVGGGCANGATTVLQTDIDTLIFTGSLRSFGHTGTAPHGSIFVVSSGDLCELTVTIDPESASDHVSAVVRDGDDLAIPGTECSAMNGEPCTIMVPDGPGTPTALRIEVTDEDDHQIGAVAISVSGKTEGVVAPAPVDAVFRNLDAADFVLWPVGPATGAYDFEWSAQTDVNYNLGVMSPGGSLSLALDTASPNTGAWPKSGAPQGWYVLSVSTTDPSAKSDPWSFTVTPGG